MSPTSDSEAPPYPRSNNSRCQGLPASATASVSFDSALVLWKAFFLMYRRFDVVAESALIGLEGKYG
ncbi:uncharacterized protein ARMOST_06580 [Armillaria ostoyae]|uniref:Uncharacterized protein n=1 Tax=Armillaria ostoyae TaxID=47428 RepID=A0A284R3C6_ARMOS|nr:uncharacterized protein ARMOST_06580 [Armillaria ostoyae]